MNARPIPWLATHKCQLGTQLSQSCEGYMADHIDYERQVDQGFGTGELRITLSSALVADAGNAACGDPFQLAGDHLHHGFAIPGMAVT